MNTQSTLKPVATFAIRYGKVEFIYTDEHVGLTKQGRTTITRASHVEPAPTGGWTADMGPSDGPVLGPFDTRGEALAAEVAWLKAHRGL